MIRRLLALACLLLLVGCLSTPQPVPVAPDKTTVKQKSRKAVKKKQAVVNVEVEKPVAEPILNDFSPIEILPDEILIVGRIRLSPELKPEEQERLYTERPELQGRAIMVRSTIEEPLPAAEGLEHEETFSVSLDEDFLLTLPHGPFALLGGYVFIDGERETLTDIRLPGSWQLEIRPDDRAIYIGTIRYVRSEYDTILDYILEDDYPQAYKKYQHRLEEGIILRKALVRRHKSN